MRMKSILVLSAFSAVTFLSNVADAAPVDTTSNKKAQASQAVQPKAVKAAQQSAPAKTVKTAAQPAAKQVAQPVAKQAVKPVAKPLANDLDAPQPKKHHAHRKGHKHKHHSHRHHRHHHHHHHDHVHYYPVHDEIPTNNFLLGVSMGYVIQRNTFVADYTTSLAGFFPGVPRTHTEEVKDSGVLFGLLAGWQWRCYRWMFGAEGSVDFSSDFQRIHKFAYGEDLPPLPPIGVAGTALYDRGNIYALTGRVGYFVTPFFMPYLRLGGQVSHDEVIYQAFFGGAVVNPDFSSRTKDVFGVVGGVGAEFPTYIGGTTIRFEYNLAVTDTLKIEDNNFPSIGGTYRYRPLSQSGKISFVWNFL